MQHRDRGQKNRHVRARNTRKVMSISGVRAGPNRKRTNRIQGGKEEPSFFSGEHAKRGKNDQPNTRDETGGEQDQRDREFVEKNGLVIKETSCNTHREQKENQRGDEREREYKKKEDSTLQV